MAEHQTQRINIRNDGERKGFDKLQGCIGIQWHKREVKLFLSIILRLIFDNSIYELRDNITYTN
jgi:hypothetical protein